MRLSAQSVERLVLGCLIVVVLWKGGKALDAVWLLALLAVGVTLLGSVHIRSVSPFFLMTLCSLLAWTTISFVFSSARNYGFDEVLQAASLTMLTLWAASRKQEDPLFAGRFAQAVSFAGLTACAVGVLVYILQPVSRFVGTFFDARFHTDYWPNAWAQFLLLLWPLLVWVLCTRDPRKLPAALRSDWVRAVVLGFILSCLLLSYSRGGFIAFGGQVLLLGFLLAFFHCPLIAWKRVLSAALVSVITAIILFAGLNALRSQFHDVQSVVRKATFSSDEGTSSVSERQNFWQQALVLTSMKPLVGWGPYSFRFVQPHLQTGVLETSDHPHNIVLKYAAERGIPAAILLLVIIAWALVAGIRESVRKHAELPLELFIVIAVAGVIAHNLIDYNVQFVGIALPLWLSIGILVSRASGRKHSEGSHQIILKILALLLLCFTVFEGVNLAFSSRARRFERLGGPATALSWYRLTDYSLFPRDAWLARGAMLLALHQLPQAEEALDQSLRFNEQDGRAWRLLGDIYLQWNKRQDALRSYEKAYAYARYDDIGITRGLVYLLKDQDAEELQSRRHEFDSLLNEFGLAIEQNTHFIALGKNVEDLVALADLLAETFPEDADAYHQLARRSQVHANEERAKTASRPRGLLW